MRAKIQRMRAILLLGAILAPCCLLVGLGVRLYQQESELAEKRVVEERRRTREQARLELLNRLEKLRQATEAREVVFRASIEAGGIGLPWEGSIAEAAPIAFGEALRKGERSEFVLRQFGEAREHYGAAIVAAKEPEQRAYASLALARVVKPGEAREIYRQMLSSRAADEYGVPFALYAAKKLEKDTEGTEAVFEREANAACCRPLAAMYLLRELMERAGNRRWAAPVAARIQMLEQAEALRAEFSRVRPQISGPDPAWVAYGERPWLVGLASPSRMVAMDAAPLLKGLAGQPRIASTGDALGSGFSGLRVEFPSAAAASSTGTLARLLFAALGLVAMVAVLGGYLLFRDVKRETHLAEMRSQFVSSVSHELKTPLTAIRMFAENLQSRPEAAPMQSEYLDIIVNESERLSRLVDNVLDLSKIERGSKSYQLRPVALDEIVRTAARAVDYPLAQNGFRLKVEAEGGIGPVRADADALKQAILNLLINAMKYSGASREIGLRLSAGSHEARIEVSDQGIGIAAEEQRRIFERFYRVQSAENKLVSGAGLGLALVQHIAEAHGGRVEVESAPGKGSAFAILLPLEEAS
ncbi:MAG: ATP-binding protein [Bryobacteraceae bacterium]